MRCELNEDPANDYRVNFLFCTETLRAFSRFNLLAGTKLEQTSRLTLGDLTAARELAAVRFPVMVLVKTRFSSGKTSIASLRAHFRKLQADNESEHQAMISGHRSAGLVWLLERRSDFLVMTFMDLNHVIFAVELSNGCYHCLHCPANKITDEDEILKSSGYQQESRNISTD